MRNLIFHILGWISKWRQYRSADLSLRWILVWRWFKSARTSRLSANRRCLLIPEQKYIHFDFAWPHSLNCSGIICTVSVMRKTKIKLMNPDVILVVFSTSTIVYEIQVCVSFSFVNLARTLLYFSINGNVLKHSSNKSAENMLLKQIFLMKNSIFRIFIIIFCVICNSRWHWGMWEINLKRGTTVGGG